MAQRLMNGMQHHTLTWSDILWQHKGIQYYNMLQHE